MRFTWDLRKATANLRKHGVSFEEAASALRDAFAVSGNDPDHSVGELRWITFGVSDHGRLLVVAHADFEHQTHIVSARCATIHERRLYEEG